MHYRQFFLFISYGVFLIFPLIAPGQDPCEIKHNKKIDKLYDNGISYFKKGNYLEASQYMKQVIHSEPGYIDAYDVLGLVNYKKANSNFREAEKNFQTVLQLCPSYDIHTYYYLAEICYSSDRYDSTIQYLNEFLKDGDSLKSDKDYARATALLKYSKFYLRMTKNPVPFQPQVVEGISTPDNEYLPALSPDNQTAFFTREIKVPPDRNTIIQTTKYKEKFMYSTLQPDGKFSEGTEMPEPFNLNDNEGGATVTIDNNTLYYTVCKYTQDRSYYNCDIYYSEYVDGEWTPIKSVSDKINLPYSWESSPAFLPMEKRFTLSVTGPGDMVVMTFTGR